MLFVLIVLPLLGPRSVQAQTPTWTWVINPPVRNGTVFNTVMTSDAVGNVYVAGSFTGSFTLGFYTLTAATAATSEVFVAKLNANGTTVWAAQGSGATSNKRCTALAVTPVGEVVITGFFAAPSAVFGSRVVTSRGLTDTFVAKLSAAGAWYWVVAGGGAGVDKGNAVALSATGDVYVAGDFESPTATFGATVLTNGSTGGAANGFVAKLSAVGAWIWARSGTVSNGANLRTHALTTDGVGNVYAGGAFSGAVAFGPITLPPAPAPATRSFVARLTSAGVWQRATSSGGPGTSGVRVLKTDAAANVYAAGHFGGPVGAATTFGSTSLVTTGGVFDAFVARLDPTGLWQWATPAGGASDDYGTGLVVSSGGDVLVKGTFQSSTATFGGFTLTNSHGAMAGADTFVAQLTPTGTWNRAFGFAGATTNDGGLGVTPSGLITVTGSFTGPSVRLGPAVLTNVGTDSIGVYFAQLDPGPLAVEAARADARPALAAWPNPATDALHLALPTAAPLTAATVYDLRGARMASVTFDGRQTLDVTRLAAGLYSVLVVAGATQWRVRFVKQ